MIYEIELTPLPPLAAGRWRVDLVHGVGRETIIPKGQYCMREAAAVLLSRGAAPDDELQARHAGSQVIAMRAPLGTLRAKRAMP